MGRRVLAGERPADIPVRTINPNRALFDARQLARWGIDEDRLPAGSTVMFRPPRCGTSRLCRRGRRRVGGANGAGCAAARPARQAPACRGGASRQRGGGARELRGSAGSGRPSHHRTGIRAPAHRPRFTRRSEPEARRAGHRAGRFVSRPARCRRRRGRGTTVDGAGEHDRRRRPPAVTRAASGTREIVGLVPALDGLCRDVASQDHIQIAFRHRVTDHRCRPAHRSACSASPRKRCTTWRSTAAPGRRPSGSSRAGPACACTLPIGVTDLTAARAAATASASSACASASSSPAGRSRSRSAPGRGTHVVVQLPIHAEAAGRATRRDQARSA